MRGRLAPLLLAWFFGQGGSLRFISESTLQRSYLLVELLYPLMQILAEQIEGVVGLNHRDIFSR